jgi:hypothetical protein
MNGSWAASKKTLGGGGGGVEGNFKVSETLPGWISTVTPNLAEIGAVVWNKQWKELPLFFKDVLLYYNVLLRYIHIWYKILIYKDLSNFNLFQIQISAILIH